MLAFIVVGTGSVAAGAVYEVLSPEPRAEARPMLWTEAHLLQEGEDAILLFVSCCSRSDAPVFHSGWANVGHLPDEDDRSRLTGDIAAWHPGCRGVGVVWRGAFCSTRFGVVFQIIALAPS